MRWFWLDRFTEFVSGSHATGVKCIALCEEQLDDHWPSYPVMPNTLIAEGMAQCGGLLVSELYQFNELVVLAKFSKCTFEGGEARPGHVLQYTATIEQVKDFGASVTVRGTMEDRPFCDAEIFFARYSADQNEETKGRVLFNPSDLLKWLRVTGVFQVGVKQDGTRLRENDYNFAERIKEHFSPPAS